MASGIAAFLAFVSAVIITIWYMNDKVLIHTGPGSQAKAWFGVFGTAMVIMYVIWSLVVGMFVGIFEWMAAHKGIVFLVVAGLILLYGNGKKKDEEFLREQAELEEEDRITNIPYTVKDENGKTEMQRLNIERDSLYDELSNDRLVESKKKKIESRIKEIEIRQHEISAARHAYEEHLEGIAKKYDIKPPK